MTFSEDDSDLSDSLSSACSTIPLPSSEMGSRAGTPKPVSASAGETSSKPTSKPEQADKSTGNSKYSAASTISVKSDKEGAPKSRIISRSHASVGPSASSDIDRPVKAESLPPPSSIQHGRRCSVSSNSPRATSAKTQLFETKSIAMPADQMLGPSGSAQHPCTSHGRLPLFEQPVLLLGARPRRTPTTAPQKPIKLSKPPRTKLNGSTRKHRHGTSDASRSSKQLSDGPSQRRQTYKDDESSLTEQSSSDEEAPTNPIAGGASCISIKRSLSPSLSHAPRIIEPHIPSSCPSSHPVLNHAHSPEATQPLASTSAHKLDAFGSFESSHYSGTHEAVSSDKNDLKLKVDLHAPAPLLKLHPSTSTEASLVLHDTSNIPMSASVKTNLEPCNGKSKVDRGVSEESALTPEPDDGPDHSTPLTIINQSTSTRPPIAVISTNKISSDQSLPTDSSSSLARSTVIESNTVSVTSVPSSSNSYPYSLIPLPSQQPNGIRPPSLSIVPTPFANLQREVSTHLVVDRGPDTETPSSAMPCSRPYDGWETGSSVPTPRLTADQYGKLPHINTADTIADDALDGVPITDDLMDYEMQVEQCPDMEAAPDNLSGQTITEESANGVPSIDDQHPISHQDTECAVSTRDTQLAKSVPDSGVDPMLDSKPLPDVEPPADPAPTSSKTTHAPADSVYEYDDHARRREEALKAMVKIEIRFAQLRDRLYIERMADVHRETAAIQQGSHPELNEYYEMLERKRSARLSLATKVFSLKEVELSKRREAATNAVWNKWNEVKTDIRNKMVTETQCQMRQIEREKSQPELRYNVEVQLLPKTIIPQAPRRRPRKRVKFEYMDDCEEILALELRAAVAKRTSLNLKSLTAQETCMDLDSMKGQVALNSHVDLLDIVRPQQHVSASNPSLPVPSQPPTISHNPTDRLDPVLPPAGSSSLLSGGKPILTNPESILMRYRNPTHQHSHPLTIDGLRSSSRSLLSNHNHKDTHHLIPDCSRSPLDINVGHLNERNGRSSSSNLHSKTDRRPTLDAVMANNNNHHHHHPRESSSSSSSSNLITCSGTTTTSSNTFSRHLSNVSGSHHSNSLYPTLPIPVNYH